MYDAVFLSLYLFVLNHHYFAQRDPRGYIQINKTPRDGSGEILPDLICEVISWGRRQDCGHLSAFEKDTEVRSSRETVSHSSQEMQVISTINNINIHARKINTKNIPASLTL